MTACVRARGRADDRVPDRRWWSEYETSLSMDRRETPNNRPGQAGLLGGRCSEADGPSRSYGPQAFGHNGATRASGFADPPGQLAFGYFQRPDTYDAERGQRATAFARAVGACIRTVAPACAP